MSYLVSKSQSLKNLPKVLFYKSKAKQFRLYEQISYVAFSPSNPKNWGELVLHKSNIPHRLDYSGPSLAIDFIK